MVKFFNFYYFFYILISIILFFGIYFCLRNKSKIAQRIVILSLLVFSFAVHFLKQLIPSYINRRPYAFRNSTFENICAVSVLIFPFIFISKNKMLKDYMFYLGLLSGLLATFIPTEAINKYAFDLDTLRFYFCHFVIWSAPLLMVLFDFHSLDYKRVWKVPICFLGVECIILINEIILISTGLVESSMKDFFDPEIRNSNFIFGLSKTWSGVGKIVMIFVPSIMKINIYGLENAYIPILWMVIPCFIYFTIIPFIISIPWEYKHIKNDFKNLKLKKNRN